MKISWINVGECIAGEVLAKNRHGMILLGYLNFCKKYNFWECEDEFQRLSNITQYIPIDLLKKLPMQADNKKEG